MGFLFPPTAWREGFISLFRPGTPEGRGYVSPNLGPICASNSTRQSLTLTYFLSVEGGSQGAHRGLSAQEWYSGEAAWLQAEGAPQTRTGSQLTSTSTCLLLLRLPAQRSPSASGKFARLPELPLFPEQKELDEVAAARARLHEELLAVTEAGNPREAVEASLGNLRSRRHTSHCSEEFIKPKRLNVNSSELNFGPVRVCCAQHAVFIQKEPTALFSQLDTKSLRIASTLLGVTSPRQPLRWRRHWAESGFPGVGAGCLCPKLAVAAITLTGSLAYHLGLL